MADFCRQCSIKIFGEDFGDLDDLGCPLPAGMGYQVICEGCGPILVTHEGVCVSKACLERHGGDKAS